MLELPTFGLISTSTIQSESHPKTFLVASWTEIIFQNTFVLRRPRVTSFVDIIKLQPLQPIAVNCKIYKLCIKMQSLSIFRDITKIADFR